jgi:hypothetical protein
VAGTGWTYSYAVPADSLRVLNVLPSANRAEMAAVGYDIDEANGFIWSNESPAAVQYIQRVTDPAKWPRYFLSAFARYLASHLAGALSSPDHADKLGEAAERDILQAIKTDSATGRREVKDSEDWVFALALVHLGGLTDSLPAPLDGSALAQRCPGMYPIVRDSLLSQHSWRFATKYGALSSAGAGGEGFSASYSAPADALRVLNVVPQSDHAETSAGGYFWAPATATIYTSIASPAVQYVARVTDPAKFPAYFTSALALALAAKIAPTLVREGQGLQAAAALSAAFTAEFDAAKRLDALTGRQEQGGTAQWILGLALSHLGGNIGADSLSPLDGMPAAQRAAQFYPLARDNLLRAFPWRFATSTVALSSSGSPATGYAYSFAEPANTLRVLNVMPSATPYESEAVGYRHSVQAGLIYTNTSPAVAQVVQSITDPAQYPDHFTSLLALLLASRLAPVLVEGANGVSLAQALRQQYELDLAEAKRLDAAMGRREDAGTQDAVLAMVLTHLGGLLDVDSVAPLDGAPLAQRVAMLLPVERDALLARHPWRFATLKATLASGGSPAQGWTYSFYLPSGLLRIINLSAAGDYSESAPIGYLWDTANGLIYCNDSAPVCQYIQKVTDPSKWPAYFVSALTLRLASKIAGALVKGADGVAASGKLMERHEKELADALEIDASTGRQEKQGSADQIIAMALAHLGGLLDTESVNPLAGSPLAQRAASFYPVVRDTLLTRHPWRFATVKAVLPAIGDGLDGWAYSFTAPADMLRPINVQPSNAREETAAAGYAWNEAAALIYSHEESPVCRYIKRVVDPAKFPAHFTGALTLALAEKLAGPLAKGEAGIKAAQALHAQALEEVERAIATDAASGMRERADTPDWIFSLALSRLGESVGNISLNPLDGSALAQRCLSFYPLARDKCLKAHAWGFATRRAALVASTIGRAVDGFAYCYELPADLLQPVILLRTGGTDDTTAVNFRIEVDTDGVERLWCNEYAVTLKYIAKVTDPAKFSPEFTTALSYLLAGYLAEALVKKPFNPGAVAQAMSRAYVQHIGAAAAVDARGQRDVPTHSPDWIANR